MSSERERPTRDLPDDAFTPHSRSPAVVGGELKAEGAGTTEAEHLLAHFVAAHMMFEKCLQKAIREQDEAAAREAKNLAAS